MFSASQDTGREKKAIILCADDFGLHPTINRAILHLLRLGRLSAVSCMSAQPHWAGGVSELAQLKAESGFSCGLHFDLTENDYPYSLTELMIRSCAFRLNSAQLRLLLRHQLDSFEQAMATRPDFIDGHQHVHQFPLVRDVVLEELQQRYSSTERPWVRHASPATTGHNSLLKASVLNLISSGFRQRALQARIKLTPDFAGMYSLNEQADYRQLMTHWLRTIAPGGLIMCHPATPRSLQYSDALSKAREQEYRFLTSDQFPYLLSQLNVCLVTKP